jgi:hypothetical protein
VIPRRGGAIPVGRESAVFANGWAVFDRAVAIANSHNVSSVTDNGVGDWTVNWTVAFAASSYAVAGCTSDAIDAGAIGSIIGLRHSTEHTTTSARVRTGASNGAAVDCALAYVIAIGRL